MKARHVAGVTFVALLFVGEAHADLRSADDKFLHGDYAAAIKEYKAITKGKEAGRAKGKLARALMRTGDLAGAEKAAQAAQKDKDKGVAADAGVVLAEILMAGGRHAEAEKAAEAVATADAKNLRARVWLGLA